MKNFLKSNSSDNKLISENMKNIFKIFSKIFAEKFGGLKKRPYICSPFEKKR